MLYNDGDEISARATLKNRMTITIAIAVCALLIAVPGFILRVKLLAYVPCAVLLCAMYFFVMLKVVPWSKYVKFLKDMREGLTRETRVTIVSTERDPVVRDGVMFYPVLARVGDGEEDERQYYWDLDKGYPDALIIGSRYDVTSFGNTIVGAARVDM